MSKSIGILTAGGDSPGLNAAIRAVGKAAQTTYDMHVIGFKDGFRGLMENRSVRLGKDELSGILTVGGTILGTSRAKPHRMPVGNKKLDMTELIVDNYHKHQLSTLICLGGGGTQKNAYRLVEKGLNVITLPKTIDNDVYGTDYTFGFDTALEIATEAIDRLHSTAHSHHRIIVCEVMGHNTGWLALGAGLAGGADVILIPEVSYEVDKVAEAIRNRYRGGKAFSIVAVSEGAMPVELAAKWHEADHIRYHAEKPKERKMARKQLKSIEIERSQTTLSLTRQLEELTGLESRLTILGHVQRGGTPSPFDRVLATQLGTAAAHCAYEGIHNVMVAVQNNTVETVPLKEVVGRRKTVPLDHPWIRSVQDLGVSLGAEVGNVSSSGG